MSNIAVRKALWEDQEGVVSLLENFYAGVPDHWRKLFAPRAWMIEDDFPGFVITDEKKIVGFLGAIFSEHENIKGKFKICNITTWYVNPDYRQYGLMLFSKIMKIPHVSWTNLTAAPHIYELFNRAGFQILEDKKVLLLPLPKLLKLNNKRIFITTEIIATDLPQPLKSIHQMHDSLCCKSILITRDHLQCYCLVVLTRFKKIPVAKIYYVSNPPFFADCIDDIRLALCRKLHVCYLELEGSMLNNKKMRGAFVKTLHPARLYKSTVLSKEEITVLGSELFVLGI